MYNLIQHEEQRMELVCPAGSLPALKAAVDNGADAVYLGLNDDTNARHFAGLNFSLDRLSAAIAYAKNQGCKVFLAVNTYAKANGWARWERAVATAAELQADALIAADLGVLGYAAEHYPELALHLSVQGSATNLHALRFYKEHFGVRRAVLPRVLSIAQVRHLASGSPVDLEVFGFGSLCIMVEGRCLLSSYVTGHSPNTAGVCSPAGAVQWEKAPRGLETRLNGVLINRYADGENAGYPTLCKGRFAARDRTYHALEEPTSLNTLELLPQLHTIGVRAIKIEGRQRSPAYVARVAGVWRAAIDACVRDPDGFSPRPEWMQALSRVSEGAQTTLGAYHRPWQ